MSTEVSENVGAAKQYVCFIKFRAGGRFKPYTDPDDSNTVVVKTMREFLDHEISRWFKASESEKALECRVVAKIGYEQFVADVDTAGLNSRLLAMLGWNYAQAARLIESEEAILILTAHPRFESVPYSFIQVRDNDEYALAFVERLLSILGGEIAFEEYDPVKHVAGCQYHEHLLDGKH